MCFHNCTCLTVSNFGDVLRVQTNYIILNSCGNTYFDYLIITRYNLHLQIFLVHHSYCDRSFFWWSNTDCVYKGLKSGYECVNSKIEQIIFLSWTISHSSSWYSSGWVNRFQASWYQFGASAESYWKRKWGLNLKDETSKMYS